MTDRHAGFIVTLSGDMRDDDSQATIAAIGQIKGVINVQPVVSDVEMHIAYQRARNTMAHRVTAALKEM